MADWSTRIPAAIEKAGELTEHSAVDIERGTLARGKYFTTERTSLTAAEVALAKALWNVLLNEGYGEGEPEDAEAALRDFTEKVESL